LGATGKLNDRFPPCCQRYSFDPVRVVALLQHDAIVNTEHTDILANVAKFNFLSAKCFPNSEGFNISFLETLP